MGLIIGSRMTVVQPRFEKPAVGHRKTIQTVHDDNSPKKCRMSIQTAGLFIVASFAVGCSKSSSIPPSPSSVISDQLAGIWNVVSIQPTGQREQATPTSASYTLTIADSRLSTRVDCNLCSGAFALSGQILTAGPLLACTQAACPTMTFGDAYTSLLSGESTVTLSGGTLVLSSERGVLRFTR
jgi:heat shock protein HslJ